MMINDYKYNRNININSDMIYLFISNNIKSIPKWLKKTHHLHAAQGFRFGSWTSPMRAATVFRREKRRGSSWPVAASRTTTWAVPVSVRPASRIRRMGWDGGNHRWNEVGWGKTNLGWAGKVGWLGNLGRFWTRNMEKCWESMEWFGKTEHGELNENWKSSKIMIEHLVIMMEDR